MDSVPYTFCDSVFSSMENLPKDAMPGSWGAVLKNHVTNRRKFEFCINFNDNQWSYTIGEVVLSPWGETWIATSLDELLAIPSKYVWFSSIAILVAAKSLHYLERIPATERQIRRLWNDAQLARKLGQVASFHFSRNESHSLMFDDYFALLKNAQFRDILFDCEERNEAHHDFLRSQLRTGHLARLEVTAPDQLPGDIRTLLEGTMKETYRIGRFTTFDCPRSQM
uniref:DUF3336 domain-containing protein n=1 Tax=Steinernema glaseri TaxID=37863 RepID=A0A1I7ZQW2_9BILA